MEEGKKHSLSGVDAFFYLCPHECMPHYPTRRLNTLFPSIQLICLPSFGRLPVSLSLFPFTFIHFLIYRFTLSNCMPCADDAVNT